MAGPDRQEAIARYRAAAAKYDRDTRSIERFRRLALARLAPRPGERILDVACGSGANLPALAEAVGPEGRVTGIDSSAESKPYVTTFGNFSRPWYLLEDRLESVSAESVALGGSYIAAGQVPPPSAAHGT